MGEEKLLHEIFLRKKGSFYVDLRLVEHIKGGSFSIMKFVGGFFARFNHLKMFVLRFLFVRTPASNAFWPPTSTRRPDRSPNRNLFCSEGVNDAVHSCCYEVGV